MAQLKKLLAGLSLKQKISIGVVALLVILGIYQFSTWRRDSDFKPLYTGVAAEDAGAIVQKIKESGVEYHLSDTGGVISVPSASVAELRISLAAAGLPKSGRIGFELFDKTTFGATEFVEHINYGRALEGELERSVSSLTAIEESRVHLTFSKDSLFIESREPAKASVVLKLRPGAALSVQNVMAIQQLVASAVEGLSAEGVSVVDTRGSLLSRKKLSPEEEATTGADAHKQMIERGLLEKINLTLDPLLGHDRYRAGVAVECDLSSTEQEDETFDPTKSVMATSQKTEEETTGAAAAGGVPGTATNLPRPTARAATGAGATTTHRTENVTYSTSHLVRKTKLPQGAIKKVSVSVLLDQHVRWEGKGKQAKLIFLPPSPETLKSIHELIAGLTGFTEDRGDQIMIESLPFESTSEQAAPLSGAPTSPTPTTTITKWWDDPKMLKIAIGAAASVVILMALGMFLFMRTRKKAAKVSADSAKLLEATPQAPVLTGATGAEKIKAAIAERLAEQEMADLSALASLKLPAVTTKKGEVLVAQLRESTKKDPTVQVQVLQTWIHGNE